MLGHFDAQTGQKTLIEVKALANAWESNVAEDLAESLDTASAELTTTRRYWIDPQDLLKTQREARDRGLSIIGVYHSHPDHEAIPSNCDRTLAWPEYSYIIVSVQKGKAVDIRSWQLNDDHKFLPEPMKIAPASAAKDRMPLLSS